jgi:hypothetical protein
MSQSQSGNVITPAMWNPQTPWPSPPTPMPPGCMPPSCFSELAALNACYNSVQMMEMILSKVVTDLATNNKAFQQALVNAIAASGSNVPLIGVTNGADAQPGQVGEWYIQTQTVPVTGAIAQTQTLSFTMQPGDWDVWYWVGTTVYVNDLQASVTPPVAGIEGSTYTIIATTTGASEAVTIESPAFRLLTSVPVLIPLQIICNSTGAGSAGNMEVQMTARRRR